MGNKKEFMNDYSEPEYLFIRTEDVNETDMAIFADESISKEDLDYKRAKDALVRYQLTVLSDFGIFITYSIRNKFNECKDYSSMDILRRSMILNKLKETN